jgi:Ran GTPase-activating protein (RanGAP) involved in mRNA processing and transport
VSQPTADDKSAIAQAQRLATRVQQQVRELATQRERIQELEAQVQWYRRLVASVGVDPLEEVTTPAERNGSQDENSASEDGSAEMLRVIDRIRRWLP